MARLVTIILVSLLTSRATWAQRQPVPAPPAATPAPTAKSDAKDGAPAVNDKLSVTHHQITLGGAAVHYAATAGYMKLPDYEGKPRANVFFIAYTKEEPPKPDATGTPDAGAAPAAPGAEGAVPVKPASPVSPAAPDPSSRPITFCFNGGPGSSSVWLHLGAIGPRRVVMDPEGWTPAPPYRLVENDQSWLDMTDLVFIDPVSTGYSRPVEGASANQFHGLDEDIQSVGEFIRLFTTKYKRWSSPKFLAGESYGTTRAAGLSGYLQETHGMYLNGIVLISSVLQFQTIRFDTGNDLPYVLFLPTYTATAWYHHRLELKLQADLAATLAEVKAWALNEYLLALAKGSALGADERAAVVKRLARYTGLSEKFADNANLRIEISNFCKELLRDEHRTVGRLDSRFKGIDATSVNASPEYDPSMAAIAGPYTAAFNNYVRTELEYENDLPYEILTGRVNPWNYSAATNRYVNVAETLRQAMTRNQTLRVFVACGYYDLATPFFAAEYTVAHLGLDPTLRDHLSLHYYDAGHMMYVRLADLARLRKDVGAFVDAARGTTP